MGHDASVVLLGSVKSSFKKVDNVPGTLAAGLAVRSKSDGTYTTATADGSTIGISLGKDLSNTGRMPVVREGIGVPILLTAAFTPTVGAQVAISNTTGMAITYSGSGDAYVNASYASGVLTGIDESGAEVDVALIDFPGGL
jgi:hypothetical protein